MSNFIVDHVEKHVLKKTPHLHSFWEYGKVDTQDIFSELQNHADYIYIRYYLGTLKEISGSSVEKYAQVISSAPISGRKNVEKNLLPHLSAYLLGSLNLLAYSGYDLREKTLSPIDIDITRLIDIDTLIPRWPRRWSHHIWRVSHWIGGIPAILLNFARYDPKNIIDLEFVLKIMDSCDQKLLIPETGLLKSYRSDILQKIFRYVYRIRHNPRHGDIGGLAHLHWINYTLDRRYIAPSQLIDRCIEDLKPPLFLEKRPYCLDFDYLHLLRTTIDQKKNSDKSIVNHIFLSYLDALRNFLSHIPEDYSLHKLAGALATLHEVALYLSENPFLDNDLQPLDVIEQACWI